MNNLNFTKLKSEEVMAIMQLTYQLIACAKQGPLSERDNKSIDVMMNLLGLGTQLGNLYWNDAVDFNPFGAFEIVSKFSEEKKKEFKHLMMSIASVDNSFLRNDIARQIFTRTNIH